MSDTSHMELLPTHGRRARESARVMACHSGSFLFKIFDLVATSVRRRVEATRDSHSPWHRRALMTMHFLHLIGHISFIMFSDRV